MTIVKTVDKAEIVKSEASDYPEPPVDAEKVPTPFWWRTDETESGLWFYTAKDAEEHYLSQRAYL